MPCHKPHVNAGQDDDGGPAGVKAEVVAHVKAAVRFRGMADFQYVSCDTRPPSSQACFEDGSLAEGMQTYCSLMYAVPQLGISMVL